MYILILFSYLLVSRLLGRSVVSIMKSNSRPPTPPRCYEGLEQD